jgi:stringent starvation protein B
MSDGVAMTSKRPYLIRAMYEWIGDNGMTPYLLVDAGMPGVRVPSHSVKDGRVVLNIAPRAVSQLELGNEQIRFMARFGGVSQQIVVPVIAVQAIYAQETGQGMMLPEDDAMATAEAGVDAQDIDESDRPDDNGGPPKRGHLRIVK